MLTSCVSLQNKVILRSLNPYTRDLLMLSQLFKDCCGKWMTAEWWVWSLHRKREGGVKEEGRREGAEGKKHMRPGSAGQEKMLMSVPESRSQKWARGHL